VKKNCGKLSQDNMTQGELTQGNLSC